MCASTPGSATGVIASESRLRRATFGRRALSFWVSPEMVHIRNHPHPKRCKHLSPSSGVKHVGCSHPLPGVPPLLGLDRAEELMFDEWLNGLSGRLRGLREEQLRRVQALEATKRAAEGFVFPFFMYIYIYIYIWGEGEPLLGWL